MIETLIPFLDGPSTLALVKASPLALQVIQRKSVWVQHVKRHCPLLINEVVSDEVFEATLAEEKSSVMNLIGILKMMEDPNPRFFDLLHAIWKGHPPTERDDVPEEAQEDLVNNIPGPEFIQLSCQCEETFHNISPYGLVFLELAEEAMGTVLQKVRWVVADFLKESELLDLDSRLLRQYKNDPEVEVNVDVAMIVCKNEKSAEAISTLMLFSERVDVQDCLHVSDDIGADGWAWLRDALSRKDVAWLESHLDNMASARRNDLRAIFDYTTHGFEVWQDSWETSEVFQDWDQFENCLDFTELAAVTIDSYAEVQEMEVTENDNVVDENNDI